MKIPEPFEVYRHFKGNYYQVVSIATHSETGEQMVVYQQLYSPYKMFVRPLDMFISKVDKDKYPQADQEYRFELQTELPQTQEEGLFPEYRRNENKEETKPVTEKRDIFVRENRSIVATTIPEVEEAQEDETLPPLLVQFLDADSYEEKLQILSNMHKDITDSMINTIAVSLDLEVKEGELEDRYREVMNCLTTMRKYECNRLR